MKKPVNLDNTRKHITLVERSSREEAEASVTPTEHLSDAPKSLRRHKAALKHWNEIVAAAEGLSLLSPLDADMLACYCRALARADALHALSLTRERELIAAMRADDDNAVRRATEDIRKCEKILHTLESRLAGFAEKLGLTPGGRAALSRRVASAEAETRDDLFGDAI